MEKENRGLGLLAFFTCLTIPLMLCAAGLFFFGVGASRNPFAALSGAPALASVQRLVVIAGDGNVYMMDGKGENKVAVTSDAALQRSATVRKVYAFPNWSPDSQRVAFVGISSEKDGTAFLYTASIQDSKPVQVFSSEDEFPFYLAWSPDSQRIAFLSQNADEMSLNYASANGGDTKTLDKGSPFYFSWSSDSQSLITHVGGSRRQSADAFIGLHSLHGTVNAKHLAISPASFLAPSWLPGGKDVLTALMGSSAANDTLVISDEQGEHQRTLVTFSGSIAFSWSPDGKLVAYVTTQRAGNSVKSELHSIKADGSDDQLLSDETPLAFFWSPDGKKIAYLVQQRGDQGALQRTRTDAQRNPMRLTWKVLTLTDKNVIALASFVPTDAFTSLVPYFDQYAQSVRLWSPDSQSLVYAANESDGTEAVYLVNANGSDQPRRIGDGSIAVWSWR